VADKNHDNSESRSKT